MLIGYFLYFLNSLSYDQLTSLRISDRDGSRDTSNNCVGQQNSNYLLRKTKHKAIFPLLHRFFHP